MKNVRRISALWLILASSVVLANAQNPVSIAYVDNAANDVLVQQRSNYTAGPGISINNSTGVVSGNYSGTNGIAVNNTTGTIRGSYTGGNGITISSSAEISQGGRMNVGDLYQGGIIFYIDQTGQHGLMVSLVDQANAVIFRPTTGFSQISPADGVSAGITNTIYGIAEVNAQGGTNVTAPYEAANYAVKADGTTTCLPNTGATISTDCYGGWYLPSGSEDAILYAADLAGVINPAITANGGTAILTDGTLYWSSTIPINDFSQTFVIDFATGIFTNPETLTAPLPTNAVRAIRQF